MKVLITGGAGFIGYYVTKLLTSKGIEVIIYDSFVSFQHPAKSKYGEYLARRMKNLSDIATIIRGDINHKIYFEKILEEHKPDKILHLAALSVADVSNNFSEEAMYHNLTGTVSILEVLKNKKYIERFVYTSSSMIYGDFQSDSIDEEHPKNPKDIYGATKYAGEIMLKSFSLRFGIPYVIVRPSAVYGPLDSNRRVTQIFVDNALNGKTLFLDNGGDEKLDFTYVEDLAMGFYLCLTRPEAVGQTFNITYGEARSLKELAAAISTQVDNVKIESRVKEIFRPKRGTLCIDKAKSILGYSPSIFLEKGIEKYIKKVKEFRNEGLL